MNHYSELASTFDSLNTRICSDCPEANCNMVKDYKSDDIWKCRSKEMGCCSFCAEKKGHLGHSDSDPDFNSLSEYFDKKYGFFDNELKTCRLPRSKRSLCCQRYICESMKKVIGEKKVKEIKDICSKIEKERGDEYENSGTK